MTSHVRVGGAFRDVSQPSIRIADDWKDCISVHSRVSGAWEEVWAPTGGIVKLSTAWALNSYSPSDVSLTVISFQPDGSITTQTNDTSIQPDADNWWTDNPETAVGADYEVAVTAISSGSFNVGLAINTWGRLDVTRTWNVRVLAKNAPDVRAANGVTFAIRPFGGGSIIDSVVNCNHSAAN